MPLASAIRRLTRMAPFLYLCINGLVCYKLAGRSERSHQIHCAPNREGHERLTKRASWMHANDVHMQGGCSTPSAAIIVTLLLRYLDDASGNGITRRTADGRGARGGIATPDTMRHGSRSVTGQIYGASRGCVATSQLAREYGHGIVQG
jgi:hypothetical protein